MQCITSLPGCPDGAASASRGATIVRVAPYGPAAGMLQELACDVGNVGDAAATTDYTDAQVRGSIIYVH